MNFQRNTFTILLCYLSINVFSQSNLNISLKGGLLSGQEDIQSKNISTYDRGSYEENANANISIGFSLPVKGKFRLGAEIGLLSFRTFLDYGFTYDINVTEVFEGRYRINQAFLAFIPEYRVFNWLYVNAGAGLYSDINSHFTSGTRTIGTSSSNITGLEYKRHNSFGYLVGAGFCPNLTKELALLAEIRYTGSPASVETADQIGIGYRAFNFNIGLMFKMKP